MNKQFVTYEIALKLKELGFDEECLGYYTDGHLILSVRQPYYPHKVTKAPLWQQVIDWLREKYNLYVNIEPNISKNWEFSIYNLNDSLLFGAKSLYINKELNYYEAREQAILKAIELCQI